VFLLFQVGDYIVYPMQGAGVIEAIEEKEVLGQSHKYYVIKMPINKMQVLIPIGNEKKARIRLITDQQTLEQVLDIFEHGQTNSDLSMKERLKINSEKLKTGNMMDGAEVVRDLMRINKNKPLNASEKQMLENARRFFISEIGLIKGISESRAADLINSKVG
jgi:CarD family transcriptional regulator